MNAQIKAILESKRAERRRLAELSFSEKMALLEKLRDRTLMVAGSALYQTSHPRGGGVAWVLRERQEENQP
jgi:hypothetical protein